MTAPDVIGLGSATLDTIGLVPHLPHVDEVMPLAGLTRQGGGPVAQALVALARLGATTGFVGRVGDDAIGAEIRAGLAAEGVEVTHLQHEPGAISSQAIILVDQPTGKRSICFARGNTGDVVVDADTLAYLCSGRYLHLDGRSPSAALAAARAARRAGVRVCVDAGHGAITEHLMPLVETAHVVIAAERFVLGALPGSDLHSGAARLLELGPEIVVVTSGEQGCYTRTRDAEFTTAAFTVDVVDTTGAGDVFHGGYLYGLLQDWDLATTAEFASAVAALKCTQLGGRAAIPRLPDVQAFLAERGRRSAGHMRATR